ncbi:H-NS histone family protein [Paracoccus sp. S-4012]|uniref:H-NS histone family protein n=1 Tax=Paracoccus sp. S-4012 TaxID=2665648 RepID=UPI0012B04010|nr:H-NS histone family protein [Paracoccus sp. S-4012]MRX49825.1 H-NS histone family protein [Paracoccus sp. S-4012]
MDIDLENKSLEELRELRHEVDRAISGFKDRKRKEAIAAAEEAVRAHGFSSLADVTRARRGAKGKAATTRAAPAGGEPRYAHPDDPSLTWSGRGRRPRWVNESLESGKSLEDLAV